jgi:hypothetical protein
MFIVAARAQQPGAPPLVTVGRPVWFDATTEPVGIQHAAASRLDGVAPRIARCGADLTDWFMFGGQPFDLGRGASCRRCVQLMSAPGQ